jgi:ABC-2 type transport system permease protein
MLGIYTKFIKERMVMLATYVSAMVFFNWLYVSLFPTMASQAAQITSIMKSVPASVTEAFGASFDVSFTHLEDLLASKHFGAIWPLVTIIFVITVANRALSGEVEDGTLAVTLAQPVSRLKLYLTRYFAGFTVVALYVAGSILSIFPIAKLYNVTASYHNNMVLLWSALAFSAAIFSLAYLASALFSTKSRAIMLSSAILFVMYIANVIAALKKSLVDLKYGSFFHYFNAGTNQVKGEYVKWEFLVFGLCALVFVAVGAIVFNLRDVEV